MMWNTTKITDKYDARIASLKAELAIAIAEWERNPTMATDYEIESLETLIVHLEERSLGR